MNASAFALASAAALVLTLAPAQAADKASKDKATRIETRVETLRIGPDGEIACSGDAALCDAVRAHGGPGQRDVRQLILRGGPDGLRGPGAFAFSPEARGPRSVTQCTRSEAKDTAPGEKTYTLTCTERQIGENEVVFLDRNGPGFAFAPPAPPEPPAPPARP